MTELEAYKWLNHEDRGRVELCWRGDELVAWIGFDDLAEFMGKFGAYFQDRITEDLSLSCDDLALNFGEVLEFFGINPENIVEKGE